MNLDRLRELPRVSATSPLNPVSSPSRNFLKMPLGGCMIYDQSSTRREPLGLGFPLEPGFSATNFSTDVGPAGKEASDESDGFSSDENFQN
jgi:hypothetical protein